MLEAFALAPDEAEEELLVVLEVFALVDDVLVLLVDWGNLRR